MEGEIMSLIGAEPHDYGCVCWRCESRRKDMAVANEPKMLNPEVVRDLLTYVPDENLTEDGLTLLRGHITAQAAKIVELEAALTKTRRLRHEYSDLMHQYSKRALDAEATIKRLEWVLKTIAIRAASR